jgi:phosphoglycerate dehydrogenase-like enzyme
LRAVFLDFGTVSSGDLNTGPLERALPGIEIRDRTPQAEVPARVAGFEAVLANKSVIDGATIRANPQLRLVALTATGVDNVDLAAAREAGVAVCNLRDYCTASVAQHAFALLLALTRGLHTAIRTPDYGLREPIRVHQRELYEQTMGIVGFGGTGRAVARRAVGFGMRVLGVDIEDVPPEPGVEAIWKPERLHEVLGASDVVVIALPLTKATRHLFTRDLFRRMKPSAILVNVTRGEIVYGDDLLAALHDGVIWGAGLDVTDPEPLPAGHPLWTHPRVVVTPHTAGGSPRRAARIVDTFCENLARLRAGRPLIALIDKPKGY